MQLVAYELELADPREREHAVHELRTNAAPPLLILNTCQRLEIFGVSVPSSPHIKLSNQRADAEAFERIARIAAGLESRILGELEVLGQVRMAYKQFRDAGGDADTQLDRIFQDALALAREARRDSGIDRNLISLSALAARTLMERVPATAPIAVVGAGSLAGSIVRYLTKRGNHPVRISSRCPENALSLASEVGGFGAGLDDLAPLLENVSGIVTATAAPHPVVYEHHIKSAARPLVIVDMGVPPDCSHEVASVPGVTYIPLESIESKAQINSAERRERADLAARIIKDGARAWSQRR